VDDLYVTAPLADLPALDGILFSAAFPSTIYSREAGVFGDLGLTWVKKLERSREAWLPNL